jgi:uncharacterized membrane protein YphA (DoxX/SURF4 family)
MLGYHKFLLGIPKHLLLKYPEESSGLKKASLLLSFVLIVGFVGCILVAKHLLSHPVAYVSVGIALGLITGFIVRFSYITQRPDIIDEEFKLSYSATFVRLLVCSVLAIPSIFGWSTFLLADQVAGVDQLRVTELTQDYRESYQPYVDSKLSSIQRQIHKKTIALNELNEKMNALGNQQFITDSEGLSNIVYRISQVKAQRSVLKSQTDSLKNLYAEEYPKFLERRDKDVLAYTKQLRGQHFVISEINNLIENPIVVLLCFLSVLLQLVGLILHKRILFSSSSQLSKHISKVERKIVYCRYLDTMEMVRLDLQKFNYELVGNEMYVDPPFDNSLKVPVRVIVDDDEYFIR